MAYERILERHRNEEVKIPFEYIRQLHELHEQWLFKRTKFQVRNKNECVGHELQNYSVQR